MFIQLKKDFLGKHPGERIDVSEEHADLLIKQGVAEAVQDDVLGPLVAKSQEAMFSNLADTINKAINNALSKVADSQSQARKHGLPAIFGEGKDGNPKRNFGDWALAVARGDRRYLEKHYDSQFVEWHTKAAMAEASGTTGGYTVPTEFYNRLMTVAAEETFIRPRAFVQPMGSATLQIPYLDITTAQSAGVTAFFGGLQMYWTGEAATRTETEPTFKMLELKAHELSGYSVSSNVLLQDSGLGLEKFLYTLFGKAIGWFEEYAFLQGNGVGKPLGMLNANCLISVTRTTANEVKYADVSTMVSRILPSSLNRAIWLCHPYVLPQLLQLRDNANRIIWVDALGGAQDKVPGMLFGRPVFITEKLPSLGTKGDLMLIDPSLYVVGDRQQVEIAASEHVNFLKNQMTWRVVERIDGQPWVDKAITLADGTQTVSPFVAIAA